MTLASPKKTTSYIEYKNGFPYATLMIPVTLRKKIGKRKYLKKLNATSPRKAQLEASILVSGWKKEIALHRALLDDESSNPLRSILMEALALREAYEQTDSHSEENEDVSERELLRDLIQSISERIQKGKGVQVASEFYGIAVGTHTPLEPFYNEWSKSKLSSYSLKTSDSYRRDAFTFVNKFVYLEAIDKKSIKRWISELMDIGTDPKNPKPMTLTTLRDRFMCGVRHFWNYLDTKGLIDEEKVNPLAGVIPRMEKTKINLSNKGWSEFDTVEVVQIYNNIPLDDIQLPTVVAIGMFTGMRIEEVCSLTVGQIIEEDGIRCFDIRDSKTSAGIRTVPIHSQLIPLVDKLLTEAKGDAKEDPKNVYLIPDLGINKYGDRSNAVGKRFGRLKTKLGFPKIKVYHSIRKCVVTKLDRAGFRETAVADVIGHDNPNMTMGRYSAGSDAVTKQKMIESLNYPFLILRHGVC
jgi:integrase